MRLITLIAAAFVVNAPAAAQEWKDYTYPDYRFGLMSPAAPQVQTTTYEVAEGRSVPAQIYSVREGGSDLKMIVADLANTGLTETAVIDYAVKKVSATGEVKLNYPHRIYQVYGRQMSLLGRDGSRSTVAMFDVN